MKSKYLAKYLEGVSCLSMVLAAGIMMGTSSPVLANPQDGVIAAGSATITSPTPDKLDIHQSSQNVVIDWRSFDIAPNEHTQFHQPSSSATALNRVNTGNASQILGKLTANGNVIIVNQAGVMFGKDSVVDVNGLVATSSDITNTNFMNGNLTFDKAGHKDSSIVNNGTITAKDAGLVGLVAPRVTNSGTITAKLGKVQLASGNKFSVDLYGDGLMNITLSDDVSTQLIENSGSITTEGGSIEMTAAAGAGVVNNLINISGELKTPSITNKNGKITITGNGSTVINTGTISANSSVANTAAGTISIKAKKISQQGKITADSTSSGAAGSIAINFDKNYIDNQSSVTSAKGASTKGGKVTVTGANASTAFISGNYDVSSTGNTGGTATITADNGDLKLFGAHVKADGKTGGGTINIGGEYQGTGTTKHASTTGINFATYLSANATDTGNGGQVIVWSDDMTKFAGHASAKGGYISGNGGLIELSSKDTLQVTAGADTNASAPHGAAGSLLLDPKNIIVQTGGISGGISSFEFVDPNPDGGEFGSGDTTMVGNGNWFITDRTDDTVATDSGAIYLFDGSTGALISSLYGASADDQIGFDSGGSLMPYDLGNNNFVFISRLWDNASVSDAGAVTFMNGTTGLSGTVSASNSLVGVQAGDFDTSYAVVLTNHNFVVANGSWDNGSVVNAGATTWGSGTTGLNGIISSANSYVGSSTNDSIGDLGITALTNGNYVLRNYNWDNVGAGAVNAGAVTWGNGATGSSGVISVANSLVGTHTNDYVGDDQVTALSNGNFLTASRDWDNGAISNAGFVYIGDGTTVNAGAVSAANSIVGSSDWDEISLFLRILNNGKIAVGSYSWDNGGALNAGAIRIVEPTYGHTSTVGAISAANSLVGTQTNDMVGYSGIYDLGNDIVVIGSTYWNDGGTADVGAVTWMDTNTPIVGAVSAANSLIGSTAGDQIGQSFRVLSNGNVLVASPYWTNASVANAGAITWMDGTTGLTGVVSTSNSLYGTSANDYIGGGYWGELGTSGNYFITSTEWDNGSVSNAGAITWGNGVTGTVGAIDSTNSLVGSATDDLLNSQITCATSTHCLFSATLFDNGSTVDAGAILLLNTSGFSGIIDNTIALMGGQAGDQIGTYLNSLSNGNYIIQSLFWDDGGNADVGAITWIDGTAGLTGVISSTNSLLGTTTDDFLTQYAFEANSDYYVVTTSSYDNSGVVDAGAITVLSTTGPTTGYMDSTNSLVGNVTGDITGDNITFLTADTGFMVNNYYDHGADIDAGAITYFDIGNGGLIGTLDAGNSIFGGANSGLYSYQHDAVNDRYIAHFYNENRIISFTIGATLSDFNSYGDSASSTITLDPTFITNVLNTGTAVTLQASNDITIDDDIIVNNASGDGGTLTFQAGRSIYINHDIFTDNGDLNIFANEDLSTGVVNAHRDAGDAVIDMAGIAHIDTGTGDVNMRLDDGTGKTNRGAGNITLRPVTANTITVVNKNATGDIMIDSGGSLTATATTGDSIVLASRRNFINYIGAAGLNVTGSARWLSYSTRDTSDIVGSQVSDFTLFNCTYGGSCGTLGTGNGFLYSYNNNPSIPTPTPTPSTDVPTTVLYVSQTPPTNIIHNGAKASDDSAMTEPKKVSDPQSDSLLNGWVTIAPELVKKLNLIWSQI